MSTSRRIPVYPGQNVHNAALGHRRARRRSGAGNDNNNLHWIENIWTTTPFVSSPSDTAFLGSCTSDFMTTSQTDCRTLIAGTSMATPHVAAPLPDPSRQSGVPVSVGDEGIALLDGRRHQRHASRMRASQLYRASGGAQRSSHLTFSRFPQ